MKNVNKLSQELRRSGIWTAVLTLLFLLINRGDNSVADLLIALPFFVVLYFFFFSIGKSVVSERISHLIGTDIRKMVVFPAFLIVLYFSYILINHKNPFEGTLSLVPYLIFFPVLMFGARRGGKQSIDWLDFTAFIFFLLPITLIDVSQKGNLPFNGNEFDTVFRIVIILTAVYAFVIVRGLDHVGFFPVINLKFFWTAIWVWMAFYLFVFIVGYFIGFIKIIGHDSMNAGFLLKIGITLLMTFLHTAIFEELFFRGILQNMLTKRIGLAKSWKIFWKWGIGISILLALLVGYTLKGGMQWFPAFMVMLIFAAAFYLERAGKNNSGVYTALAITSAAFGLVHYHSGAIIYIGFACLAGWAYGYTYLKTRNVFYSAIVHTLVNGSVLIFGLELVK